jgi:hypothetical protein
MTTVLVSETDSRGPKAVKLAADAGQWLKCHTRDGRKAYGIQSSLGDGCYYLVTRNTCTCYDAHERHNECKHMLAVRLHCNLLEEQQAAKSDDIFARFAQDDRPLATPELSRILGKPQRGVIPASQIERED